MKQVFAILFLLVTSQSNALPLQNDLSPQQSFRFDSLSTDDIDTSKREYLVFTKNTQTNQVTELSLWTRQSRIVEKMGLKYVETTQTWRSNDPKMQRELSSLNRLASFAPVSHTRVQGSERKVEAFVFTDEQITGNTDVSDNTQKDFAMPANAATYNWELDIETFALLPLAMGKSFAINFYHPGSKNPPKNYLYTVVGEDVLSNISGDDIPCWQLKIEYQSGTYAIFWLRKSDGQMLKMQSEWEDHIRTKVRLGIMIES